MTPRRNSSASPRGVPPLIRFGTSSWTYPGWKGLVYHQDYGGKGTAAPMLAEYSRFPLFRTVGIDSSFYGPPTDAVLAELRGEPPARFSLRQQGVAGDHGTHLGQGAEQDAGRARSIRTSSMQRSSWNRCTDRT